jgi:hypothetical protein
MNDQRTRPVLAAMGVYGIGHAVIWLVVVRLLFDVATGALQLPVPITLLLVAYLCLVTLVVSQVYVAIRRYWPFR